jgi:UDP-N-acetyl-D-mannosaminouronate:lipid I N-acetyl-D-mannosaminouronosyltransferase
MIKNVLIGGVEVSAFKSINDVIDNAILSNSGVIPGVGIAINPEKIIAARRSRALGELLAKATLKYPDGIGVSYVMNKKLKLKVARIPGCELWEQLMVKSVHDKIPVFLVGASESVLQQTKNKLIKQGVNVVGVANGYFPESEKAELIDRIKNSGAKIVSVALGSPKQEYFMFECRNAIPDNFYMGVGGTYDVFTENVKRAPVIFRQFRCEWLYRLLSQPTRMGRQANLLKYIGLYFMGKL